FGAIAAGTFAAHLVGLRAVLVGPVDGSDTDGTPTGLGPLLTDELQARLAAELNTADNAVAAVAGPLRQASIERPEQVAVAREAIKAVQITVATEVVAQLGVTIGFSDADGDTGS
ncbi:MAG: hypothetical protein AAFO29_10350, partial [Actinomycetota bacterium]